MRCTATFPSLHALSAKKASAHANWHATAYLNGLIWSQIRLSLRAMLAVVHTWIIRKRQGSVLVIQTAMLRFWSLTGSWVWTSSMFVPFVVPLRSPMQRGRRP